MLPPYIPPRRREKRPLLTPLPLGAWILAPSALSFRGLQLYNPGYAPDLTRTLLDSQLYCPKIRL